MRRRHVGHLVAATVCVTVLAVALGMLAPVLTTLLVLVFMPLASIVLMRDRHRGSLPAGGTTPRVAEAMVPSRSRDFRCAS